MKGQSTQTMMVVMIFTINARAKLYRKVCFNDRHNNMLFILLQIKKCTTKHHKNIWNCNTSYLVGRHQIKSHEAAVYYPYWM